MLNLDIIHLIAKYNNIKFLAKIDKIVWLSSKEKNKLKYYKNFLFKCVDCCGELLYHYSPTNNRRYCPLFCISNHKNNESYYYCANCQYFYLCCPECSNDIDTNVMLCQFLGFRGCYTNKRCRTYYTKFRIINKSAIKFLIKKYSNLKIFLYNNILTFDVPMLSGILCEEDILVLHIILFIILEKYKMKDCFYDVSDLDLEHFDIKNHLPTGIFGRSSHYWKCKNCLKIYEINAKEFI